MARRRADSNASICAGAAAGNKSHVDGTVRMSDDADSGTVALVVIASVTVVVIVVALVSNGTWLPARWLWSPS